MNENLIYAACDRAIQAMNRENLRAFGRLKLAKWDEIHVIRTVTEVYQRSVKRAKQRYYEVAFEAYILGLILCGVSSPKAHAMAEKAIDEKFVDDILEDIDLITLYRFTTETDRKAQKLAEALEVATAKDEEIDKALKAWSRQVGQYAINVTDYALVQAYEDAGVNRVRWVSVNDERRCSECRNRDGKIYRLDEVPPKHPNCRCHLIPVR